MKVGIHFSSLILLLEHFVQIRDDFMNIHSEDYTSEKGSCEKLNKGK